MLLVPRQLQRAGMTGDVPYYGGRFTPEQAYVASHPAHQHPSRPRPRPAAGDSAETHSVVTQRALQHLLESGVITREEHQTLRARVPV
jgi:hypothetical protein